MPQATGSGCVNHPGVEAVARCKACRKPVCATCVVTGPTGQFCSETCREKHEAYVKRARDLDRTSRRTGDLAKVRRLLIKLVILVVGVGALAWICLFLDVPVVADAVRAVLRRLPISPG